MTDEPHNAPETEPAGKLPTIVAVHATGPISLRITWSDGIEGELNLTTVLADRHFAALRDPAEFARVGVGEWGHSLAWPSGVELGADMLRHETELAQARKGSWDDLRGMMKGNGARFTIEEINDAIAGASAGMAGMGDHDRS
ncbi:MAG: DUF2442 domain-containing protein [Pseudomonadota bacterium]|nr:DUF2442 domain-containing protein [Pseudomonadota bacterium]